MPGFDLEALWEEHCRCEFETRDVDATMATMVDAPYVNHIPTMTGGVGHDELKRFYKYHFIGANPPDTKLVPVSRTVGTESLVDEMLFCFTHTSEIDWMVPGVPPTGRRVEVPLVAIVKFREGKVRMSISTGTRPPCSRSSACSILAACRRRASRRRGR